MISEALISKLSVAIADEEGFYVTGSVPARANNPGDLSDDKDIGNGVIHTAGPAGASITIYSNPADGWAALERKVRRMLSGASLVYLLSMSIEEVGMKWSEDSNWGKNVAAKLGVSPDTTLEQLVQADLAAQGENA
jgi:hypothetical protein